MFVINGEKSLVNIFWRWNLRARIAIVWRDASVKESIWIVLFSLSYLRAVPTNASNKIENLSVPYLCLPFYWQTRTTHISLIEKPFLDTPNKLSAILIVRNQNRKFQMFHSLHLLAVRHSVHFHPRNYFHKIVMCAETKRHFLCSASARLIRTNPRHHAACAHFGTRSICSLYLDCILFIRNLHVFRFRFVRNQHRIIQGENISFELTTLTLRSRTGNNNCSNQIRVDVSSELWANEVHTNWC